VDDRGVDELCLAQVNDKVGALIEREGDRVSNLPGRRDVVFSQQRNDGDLARQTSDPDFGIAQQRWLRHASTSRGAAGDRG
jgi:hypothetical protein